MKGVVLLLEDRASLPPFASASDPPSQRASLAASRLFDALFTPLPENRTRIRYDSRDGNGDAGSGGGGRGGPQPIETAVVAQ